jgi:sulfate/thiosulfate transport system ATP-binding protein
MQVAVREIHKRFGATQALAGVSLDAPSGGLLALLGPSGSGKTTLLRVVAGLEQPEAGQVLFGMQDTSRWPIQKRQIGFVFQHYALFKHMNVFDNIAFGQQVRKRTIRLSQSDIKKKVLALLDLVQLTGLEKRYPSQLSGGQRQRVALARALAIDPQVLLLDEPFGALDAKVRKDLRRWLREIHSKTGLTTLFVTHDQEEALELADQLVVLNHGQIEQMGDPDTVFDQPKSAFVHDFIGESIQLAAQARAGQLLIDDLPTALSSQAVPQGPVRVFMRPQHLQLSTAQSGGLPATVFSTRRSGARYRIEAALQPGCQRVELEVDEQQGFVPGALIHVKPTRWHVYPL